MKSLCLTPTRLTSKLLVLISLASSFPAHAQTDTTTLICRAESEVHSNWKDDGTFMRGDSGKADDVYIFSLSWAEITYRSASKSSEELLSDVEGPAGRQLRESYGKERDCNCNHGRAFDCVIPLQKGKQRRNTYVALTCQTTNFAFNPQNLFFFATSQIPFAASTITRAGSCTKL